MQGVATGEGRDHRAILACHTQVPGRDNTPKEDLLALFDFLQNWYESDGFHGCMFINATVEFPGKDDAVKLAAAGHKQALYDYVCELTRAACPDNADALSRQLVLLMEGAIVTTQVTGNTESARQARSAAQLLLEHVLARADAPA